MSNLDYPISVLTEERDNIHGLPKNRAEQLNEAIDILIEKKKEDEIRERERREKVKEITKGIINEEDVKF